MSGRNGGGALRPRKRWLADQLDWLSNEPQWRRGLTTPQTRMGGLRLKKFLPCRNGGGALRPRKHVTCRLGWPHDGLAAMEAGPYDPANLPPRHTVPSHTRRRNGGGALRPRKPLT